MNLIQSFKNLFVSEPQKTFQKAGITDSNGILTSDGQAVFLAFLLAMHGEEFRLTIVDKMLAEQEADKK